METMTTSETTGAAIEPDSALDEIDAILAKRADIWPDTDPRWSALGSRIIRIARYLVEDRSGRLAAFGMTPIEFDVLMILRITGGPESALFPSEIADTLLLNRNRVTAVVDRLCTRELVERFENPSDRRQIVVCLSAQGHVKLDAAFAAYQGGLRELLESLDESQHEAAVALMRLVLLGVQDRVDLDATRPDTSAY